jgi:hypothetical protein
MLLPVRVSHSMPGLSIHDITQFYICFMDLLTITAELPKYICKGDISKLCVRVLINLFKPQIFEKLFD